MALGTQICIINNKLKILLDSSVHKMIIVSAPSGAGKTTIVNHLLKKFPQLGFSVSATSRKMREGEKNGREYYFITSEEFKKLIDSNKLLEWQEVYPGSYYGTLVSEVIRINENGQIPVFDVDVVGGLNIKKLYGSDSLALFINPPSMEILEARLRARATDNEESLQKRLSKVKWELSFEKEFDKVIVNDTFENAFSQVDKIVSEFFNL